MTLANLPLDAEDLITACKLGKLESVKYYLDNFSYRPQIYANDNQCLREAYLVAKSTDIVLLLCEKVHNLEYFESSAKNWPNNSILLKIIKHEKAKRCLDYFKNILSEKSDRINSIKI